MGLYDASMKRVHAMAQQMARRETEETMEEMKITWSEGGRDPLVRLADVDRLIGEAVWAMEEMLAHLDPYDGHYESHVKRAQAFLVSPLVAAWRERQEGTAEMEVGI